MVSLRSLSGLPQGCPRNSSNICLSENTSFSTLEGGMSISFFLHSSFLQVISAVMLWPVHVQKVPQASEHFCPAKLQTRCDICCACQSICPFIPTDSGVPRAADPQKSLWPEIHRSLCGPAHDPHCISLAKWLRRPPGGWQILGSVPIPDLGTCPGSVTPVTFNIGTAMTALPGAWHCRVIAGTGWAGVSIL